MSETVTCRELVDFLADYLAGELAPEVRAAVDFHLARCPGCVSYMNSYRATSAAASAAFGVPDDPVPGDVPEELVRAVLAARSRGPA